MRAASARDSFWRSVCALIDPSELDNEDARLCTLDEEAGPRHGTARRDTPIFTMSVAWALSIRGGRARESERRAGRADQNTFIKPASTW
jgi:hypothetical protein